MPPIITALRRTLLGRSATALISLAGALLLRWALDPILQNDLPLVTLFGAVAITVWVARWRFALITSVLGYGLATYFFVGPRNQLSFRLSHLVGLVLYAVSCAIIIYFGERMHRANARVLEVSASRIQLQDALTSEKELLATTLASIGDAVIVTDSEGRIVSLNTEAERLTGWTTAESIGTSISRVFHIVNEQNKTPVENPVNRALRDAVVVGLANHTVLISKNGREIPIDDSAAPIRRADDGPVLGVALVFRDVTEQRRAQAVRSRLAAIVEFSGDAIITKNLKGIIQTWNKGAERLFGYSAEEIVGKSATTLFPADRVQEEDAILEKLRRGQFSERLETIRVTKDGDRIPVLVSVSPLRDADGEVNGASTIIHDVSEIVAARDELTREKELLATTLVSIGDAVIVTDPQSRVTFLNTEAEHLTGWTKADAVGRPLSVVFRIVNEHTRRVAENPVEKALRLGAVVGLANHTMLLRSDGIEFLIDDSAAPIKDQGGLIFGVVLVFRDVTDQRKAYGTREELAAIVEYSGEAIVTKNLEGIIQTWNASAQELFGYRADEIVGKAVTTIIPPDRLEEEEQILSRLRRGLRAERLETIRIAKDGREIPVLLTVSPLKNAEGEVVGASKLIQDISDRKRIEQERQQLLVREQALRSQAEEAGRIKDEFLATVSHELRTPLSAILGWATLLKRGDLDEIVAIRGVDAIERNAKAQAELIEDLLDVSRIISGKLRIDVKPVSLVPIVEVAIDTVKPAADAKAIRIEVSMDQSLNHLRADSARLQQVIWNLLSNSIKFTAQGGVVQIKVRRSASMAEIVVKDTGIGIEPEFLPFVFDRFRQADASLTRKHGGLGLGLSITRHLVEMHGGTIEAESEGVGRGATFTVKLPIPAVALSDVGSDSVKDESQPNQATAAEAPDLRGIRVLAIDDSADTRELLSIALEKHGASVITASSAREALDLLAGWKPDVLVCDIGMPEEDGYDLIRRIRQLPKDEGGNIPAVALTGYVRIEDRMRALESGYEMFVPKPIEAGELCTIVSGLLERNEGR